MEQLSTNKHDHLIVVCLCVLGGVFCSDDETRLVKSLFTGYNKVVRPVNHFKDAVAVTVGLQLIQLISVVRKTVFLKLDFGLLHRERNNHCNHSAPF